MWKLYEIQMSHTINKVWWKQNSCIVYDCFHTTTAHLHSFSRDWITYKVWNIYSLVLYRKHLLALALGESTHKKVIKKTIRFWLDPKSSIMESKGKKSEEGRRAKGKGLGNLVRGFMFISSCCHEIMGRGHFCSQRTFDQTVEGKSNEEREETRGIKLLRESSNIGNVVGEKKLMPLRFFFPISFKL